MKKKTKMKMKMKKTASYGIRYRLTVDGWSCLCSEPRYST